MDKYKDYEEKLKEEQEKNKKYMDMFEKRLQEKGLSSKTIRSHLNNVDTYLDYYLNYYEINEMPQGCYMINGYLGDFFIRKCMWSTAYTTKQTASSIKKFYACMNELGYVSKDDYNFLCKTIKDNMDNWIEEVEEYNSVDFDDYF